MLKKEQVVGKELTIPSYSKKQSSLLNTVMTAVDVKKRAVKYN